MAWYSQATAGYDSPVNKKFIPHKIYQINQTSEDKFTLTPVQIHFFTDFP
jgi:hypothetical protein